MGQPRPPEAFHRVYSPPEPPPPGRRPTAVGALTIVLVLVLGAAAVMVYDRRDSVPSAADSLVPPIVAARPSAPPPEEPPPSVAASTASPRITVPRLFTMAPRACVVVSPATVRRLVPAATIASGGGAMSSTCDYSAKAGSRHRELRVETQIFAPKGNPDPVDEARLALDHRWTDARRDPVARTVDIERVPGLGDEAYRRYATDHDQPMVVGEVVVRVRNSVAAVSYVVDAPDGGGEVRNEVRRRCIAEATTVIREILLAFE